MASAHQGFGLLLYPIQGRFLAALSSFLQLSQQTPPRPYLTKAFSSLQLSNFTSSLILVNSLLPLEMVRHQSRFSRGRRVIDEEEDSEPAWNGRQGHGRMDHGVHEEPIDKFGGHRGDHLGQELDNMDLLVISQALRGRPPGGRGARSHELHDLMGDMELYAGPSRAGGGGLSRQDESEIARLRETHARMKADLQALSDGYDVPEKAIDQGMTRLLMIEEDTARIKYKNCQGGQGEKMPRGRGAPTGSTHLNPRQSHVEGKGQADKGKYSVSDLPKLKQDRHAMDYELGYFAEIGNRNACKMVEKSIANINRHISRLEAESGKGVEAPRGTGASGMGASMRPQDPRHYPDEYLDYQPRGSHRGYHERSAGYGGYSGHQSRR